MTVPNLEQLLKNGSTRLQLAEACEKKAMKDPENSDLIFSYFKAIGDPGFQNLQDPSQVPEEFWAEYSGLQFRKDLKSQYTRAESDLVGLVSDDYSAALNLIDQRNLPRIFDDLPAVDLGDEYKNISLLHSQYKAIHDLLENPENNEQAKIDKYVKGILKASGKVEELLRRFYMRRGGIDQRLEQAKKEMQMQLLRQFTTADGSGFDYNKIKEYIKAVVDKTPQNERNSIYLAIGKYAA